MNPKRKSLGAIFRYLLVIVCCDRHRTRRHFGIYAAAWFDAVGSATGPGRENSTRPTGLSRCTHCPLSRPDASPNPRSLHVSSRTNQLQQWLAKNPGLKDKALADAVVKQPWDPSIQGVGGAAEVVKRLADDIQWTTDLGNAFLAQQRRCDGCRVQRMAQEGTRHRQF